MRITKTLELTGKEIINSILCQYSDELGPGRLSLMQDVNGTLNSIKESEIYTFNIIDALDNEKEI